MYCWNNVVCNVHMFKVLFSTYLSALIIILFAVSCWYKLFPSNDILLVILRYFLWILCPPLDLTPVFSRKKSQRAHLIKSLKLTSVDQISTTTVWKKNQQPTTREYITCSIFTHIPFINSVKINWHYYLQ